MVSEKQYKDNKRANLNIANGLSPREINVAFNREKKIILIQPLNRKPVLRVIGIRNCTPIFAFSSFKSSLHTTEICLATPKRGDKLNFHVLYFEILSTSFR